jgi:type IV pilus assembly protein PilA
MDRSRDTSELHREAGFTLVELLVVLMIIGILSTIAISVFLRQRDKAWDADVVSDLRGAVTAQHTFLAGSSPEAFAVDVPQLVSAGFAPSSGDAYHDRVFAMTVTAVGSESFCMTARSGSGKYYAFGSATGLLQAASPLDPVTCS